VVLRALLFLTVIGPTIQAAEASKSTPLVIILDGAGDLKGCSTGWQKAKELYGFSFQIETFPWSHGHGIIYRDQVDDARHHGVHAPAFLKQRVFPLVG
jgi:hypothetical protein